MNQGEEQDSLCRYQESIIDNAHVMMVVLDLDGTVRVWNRAAEQITGYPASDVVGNRDIWKNLYPDPGYRKKITGRIKEILSRNNYFENLETKIKGRDGSIRTIAWNTRKFPTGTRMQAIAVGRDITDLKIAEERLITLSEFNEAVIRNAHILIAVLDRSGTIYVWNRAAEQVTGYTGPEVIGSRDIWKYLYPDRSYRREVTRRIEKMIQEKNYFENLETTIRAKNGSSKIISWNTREIPYHGESRVIAVGWDITAQKEAELALVSYITEAAMRLKNPVEIIRDNLTDIRTLVEKRQIEMEDVISLLDIQARNAAQIVQNLQELQQAIAGKFETIPDSYRKFLMD